MPATDGIIVRLLVLNETISSILEPKFRKHGLTFGLFELLAATARAEEVSQAEVARRLGIAPASLCEAVQSACRKGLIEQSPSPTDRRVKNLRLTARGRASLRLALQEVEELEKAAAAKLSSQAMKQALSAIDKLDEALGKEQ